MRKRTDTDRFVVKSFGAIGKANYSTDQAINEWGENVVKLSREEN